MRVALLSNTTLQTETCHAQLRKLGDLCCRFTNLTMGWGRFCSGYLFPLKLPNDGQCFALECRVDYDRPAGGSATESWPSVFLERLKPFCFHSFSDFSGMLGGASAEAEPTSPEDAASSKASQLVVLASAPTGNEEQDTSLTTLTCQLVYDLWQKRNNQQAEAGAEGAGTNGATSAQQVDEDAMLENEITFQSGGMNFAMQISKKKTLLV